jgi:hypothetical protein
MKTLRDERGTVIVTAMMMLMIMVAIGLAALSQVDTQTSQSRQERERESSFNLAEAALSAQTFVLGRRGTGTATIPYPTTCSTSASTHFYCPPSAQLMRSYNGSGQVDFDDSTTWTTWVRDDANPTTGQPVLFWDDTYLTNGSWARYDRGGAFDATGASIPNRHVWVRAEATVRGKTRALIAYVRIEDKPVNFPQYAVLAGSVRGQNNGNKTLVNSTGSPLGLGVRCGQPPPSANCIDLSPTKGPQLVPPGAFELNIPGNSAAVPPDNPAIDADALQSLEDVAKASGTYYAGLLIVKKGAVNFGGNIEFFGLVYNANLDNSTGTKLIETSGTSAIRGAALVDGRGGVWAGSSGNNIMYESLAFANINAVGTAGVVQNTWREIVPDGN